MSFVLSEDTTRLPDHVQYRKFSDPIIERFFNNLAESLDISSDHFITSKKRYENLAMWLQREESKVAFLDPDIHPQGSFALGTVIKPYNDVESFDVDLICLGNESKTKMTQRQLKELVGTEIKAYAKANSMKKEPDEGRRNWKLEYADGAQFHMDILPSLSDPKQLGFKIAAVGHHGYEALSKKAISITDQKHPEYNKISIYWSLSNPLGYRDWFKGRMKVAYNNLHRTLAMKAEGIIEDVPDYKIKTPLQKAIQILKRHRDMMFIDDMDNKPISIIITTLAAHVYNNELSLLDALKTILARMEDYIKIKNGETWIQNPANPLENFADKWQEHPIRKKNFYDWLEKVREDFDAIFANNSISSLDGLLKENFGTQLINQCATKTGYTFPDAINKSTMPDLSHREQLKWKYKDLYNVSITTKMHQNGFRPIAIPSKTKVVKHVQLHFHAHTNAPKRGLRYYWQVVNTGREATAAHGLRGNIFMGTLNRGRAKHQESTLYAGIHWIECFAVINGECVGRSGEFLVEVA